jgi:MFS family permease
VAEAVAGAAVAEPAAKDQRWNFLVNLWDEIFIMLGISLVSRETVLPVLVAQLTDSKLAIGLIPAIFSLGMYLPQLLVANFSERLPYKKGFVMWASGPGERGAYLLMGLSVWLLADTAPTLTLILVFGCLALNALCIGLATPAWFDMIAKVIPPQRRGLLFGLGRGLGSLLGVAGAFVVGRILTTVAFPQNFVLVFAIAFVVMTISWVGLALTREPPSTTVKPRIPSGRYLRQLPGILRTNRNYRQFLLSRTIIQLGTMATGFYMVYGIERFQIDGAGVGALTAVLVFSVASMNLVWGLVGDRLGHKTVLAGAASALAMAALLAWFAPSSVWLFGVFALLGIYTAGDGVSALNIILEFCDPADRPTYIGLTNTLLAPVLTLAPLIGGWLATTAGYSGLFLAAMLAACTGCLLMTFWVQEPRNHMAPSEGLA